MERNKKTRYQSIVTAALLCLLTAGLSGCEKKAPGDDSARETLQMLSSAECEGRLYGTKGNDKAHSYLSQKLEDYGFVPFEDTYNVPFEAELPKISGTSLSISKTEKEGAENEESETIFFEEGRDYFSSLIKPLELSGTISEVTGTGKEREMTAVCEGGITLTFRISQFRISNSWKISGSEEFKNLTIGVSENTMEELSAHTGDIITYCCKGAMETMTLDNVMGVLKGEDSSSAIVLGAHFDHMGKIGDTLYAGAVDNASGAAALLAACRELFSKQKKPETDIIVCFWNAEEEGQQGSKAGAELIAERYNQYCYINLDCVGMIDGGSLQVTTANNSGEFCGLLKDLLENAGCENVDADGEQMTSDHNSFAECPSVNIGQGNIMNLIHTPQDTAENVDSEQLEQLARGLSEIVQDSSRTLLEKYADQQDTMEADQTYEERQEYIRSIERRLAYDEYMLIPDTGDSYSHVSSKYLVVNSLAGVYFNSLEDAKKVYPKLQVKEQIGDYKLVQLMIQSEHMPADESEEPLVPLKRLFSEDAIISVWLYYENEERAFSYTQYLNGRQDSIEETKAGGMRTEKIAGRKNAWMVYFEDWEKIPNEYVQKIKDSWVYLCQGSILKDSDGICIGCANWKNEKIYTKKSLEELGKRMRAQGEIIKIED